MSARDHILRRLRSAPQTDAPQAPDARAFHAAERARQPVEDRAARIARFCEKMAFWHGEVVKVTRRNWIGKVRELCAAKGVATLLYGARTAHGKELAAAGVAGLAPYERPIEEWKQALFENIDAGITSTRGGIAETGTLIVWPDASEPRLMSLVPPIHFALLDAGQLYDTLLDAMFDQRWSGADGNPLPANALLVSGPSKTADIQVTLAYGAHGPKELIVLLLVDEEELR
ncbi:MAG: lactate utilization protein [Betaproteobacteria bacterium]|nr:lactate utilization protein [Betaproteobacteria bacterium]